MKALLQFVGVLSLIGAVIALVLHFNADKVVKQSAIFISMFATGLLQALVFLTLSEILSKLDIIINVFKVEGKIKDGIPVEDFETKVLRQLNHFQDISKTVNYIKNAYKLKEEDAQSWVNLVNKKYNLNYKE